MNPYAYHLEERNVVEVLTASPATLHELVAALGPGGLSLSLAPGKWPVSSILSHLADAEIAFGFRLRQGLAEENHVTQPWDQDAWAAVYPHLDGHAALHAFTAIRGWNLAWIHSVPQPSFGKSFIHPERGEMTLGVVVETMAGHDLHHIKQIQAIAGQHKAAS